MSHFGPKLNFEKLSAKNLDNLKKKLEKNIFERNIRKNGRVSIMIDLKFANVSQ